MDSETKHCAYDTSTYAAAGSTLMSFKPVNAIHQHLCAFHVYAHDRTRHVEAHHFCTHQSKDLHQCIIYDSDQPNARLIGVEYIVPEKIFVSLPAEEKKFWHSHKYEVESGALQLQFKDLVPGLASDAAEQPAMLELHTTYGKTIHTWQFDTHPELPLGPPTLMMSYTGDGQADEQLLRARDEKFGMDTQAKRELRTGYLPPYQVVEGAYEWQNTGKGVVFEAIEYPLK